MPQVASLVLSEVLLFPPTPFGKDHFPPHIFGEAFFNHHVASFLEKPALRHIALSIPSREKCGQRPVGVSWAGLRKQNIPKVIQPNRNKTPTSFDPCFFFFFFFGCCLFKDLLDSKIGQLGGFRESCRKMFSVHFAKNAGRSRIRKTPSPLCLRLLEVVTQCIDSLENLTDSAVGPAGPT